MDMDTAIAVAENVADEKPLDGGLVELLESLWGQKCCSYTIDVNTFSRSVSLFKLRALLSSHLDYNLFGIQ